MPPPNGAQALLQELPSVQSLLQEPTMQELAGMEGHTVTVEGLRHALHDCRSRILAGDFTGIGESEILDAAWAWVKAQREPTLRPVINATGVLLHTNLGRAPLSSFALQAVHDTASGYSTLEYDLLAGTRSDRYRHCRRQLQELTGAEDALVVNNNAAALFLLLTAFCRTKEVIISRSQLVEIGGGFRIPDILRESGADLVEVGTTNRTYASDYQDAVTERTAALLCVHASNFRQSGFVHQPSLAELAGLAKDVRENTGQELLLLHDLGSGNILRSSSSTFGLEQTVGESVAQGADLTAFSGDKMLGGPQAGILVGRHDLIVRLLHHPLLRALRMDKVGLAGLSATLDLYLTGRANTEVPLLAMGKQSLQQLLERAEKMSSYLKSKGFDVTIVELQGAVGGGSLPEHDIPSYGIELAAGKQHIITDLLRAGDPPVIARIHRDRVCLDLRTVLPDQDQTLQMAVSNRLPL